MAKKATRCVLPKKRYPGQKKGKNKPPKGCRKIKRTVLRCFSKRRYSIGVLGTG